jgi:4-amino-4-deoxy-L-arabinose transferase-like glycosyltransferase
MRDRVHEPVECVSHLRTFPGASRLDSRHRTEADVGWRGVLLVIVLSGIALRLFGLNGQSLWGDEVWSVYMAREATFAAIAEAMRIRDVHPPGYDFLLALVIRAFGDAPAVVRLPSAVAGSLAVLAIYYLGRLLFGVRCGLFAAAMLAVSSTSIYYSQETRSYAWLLLLSIVSSYYFARVFRPSAEAPLRNPAPAVLYVVLAIVLAYTHYFGLLVLGVHAVVAVMTVVAERHAWWRLLVFPLIGLGYLPWLPATIEHMQIAQFWIERPTARSLVDFLAFAFNGRLAIAASATLVCALAVLAQVHAAVKVPAQAMRASAWTIGWLVLWVVLPLAVAFGKSLVSTSVFTNRNLIICFPPLFLLTARAADVLIDAALPRGFVRHGAWIGCLAILSGGVLFLARSDFYEIPNRAQYREAVQAVVYGGIPLSDLSVVTTDEYFDYYLEQLTPGLHAAAIAYTAEHVPALRETLAAHGKRYLWYLQGFTRTGPNPVLDRLNADYVPLRYERFAATEATLFRRRSRDGR